MPANADKIKKISSSLINLTGKAIGTAAKFSGKLDPLVKIPFVGGTIAEVQDIVCMLDDYYQGNYKKIPVTAILGCLGIIGYLASPIDLIPDKVPILGFIDDAFVINIIVELCVEKELENYRSWRNENRIPNVIDAEIIDE